MQTIKPDLLFCGLDFKYGESPRWHDDRLWFSDIYGEKLMRVDTEGEGEVLAHIPSRPSGMGWLSDGTHLVVTMEDKQLNRFADGVLAPWVDLAPHVTGGTPNDMVIDSEDRCYVSQLGFDLFAGEQPRPTQLILVTPDGDSRPVAVNEVEFPNGICILDDDRTLIVSESFTSRLWAFDIEGDGELTNRRLFAQAPIGIDGICCDAAGAVWVGCVYEHRYVRMLEGSEITDEVVSEDGNLCIAPMLGGGDGRTLFMCTTVGTIEQLQAGQTTGLIEMATVDIPRAGRP